MRQGRGRDEWRPPSVETSVYLRWGALRVQFEQLVDVQGEGPIIQDAIVCFDQLTVGCEEEGDGYSDSAVEVGNLSVPVEEVIEWETELRQKRFGVALIVRDVDTYELDLLSVPLGCLVQQGSLRAAWQAP